MLNSSVVLTTIDNSESDVYSWLASIRMASEDVTCGERIGDDRDRLTSAVAT